MSPESLSPPGSSHPSILTSPSGQTAPLSAGGGIPEEWRRGRSERGDGGKRRWREDEMEGRGDGGGDEMEEREEVEAEGGERRGRGREEGWGEERGGEEKEKEKREGR